MSGFGRITFTCLHDIAEKYHLKNINRIKTKKTLICKLRIHLSAIRVQKWVRGLLAYNDKCPVSLEYIRYPCWGYKVNNKFVYYNLPGLAYFFVSSGDFRDPATRNEIFLKDINKLSAILKYYPHMRKIKLLKAFNSGEQFKIKRQMQERRDVLDDTIRTVIMEIIEDLKKIEYNINLEVDIDVQYLLSPKICEFKICTGILSNICQETYIRIINWSIENIKKQSFCSLLVKKLQISLVEFMKKEIM
jgi:hypothetical protein